MEIEKLIKELPEVIFFGGKKTKAFLEVTGNHVYYCTKHDNRGNLSCAFISIRPTLEEMLEEAKIWIDEGIKTGDIIKVS